MKHVCNGDYMWLASQIAQLEAVIEALRNAKKPVIYAGGKCTAACSAAWSL